MDCPHPLSARICYRDRAAPLGREGQDWCDRCGERVDPEHSCQADGASLMTVAWTDLGDGVYAAFDGFQIWLMTQPADGWQLIALQPSSIAAIVAYADKVWAQRVVMDALDGEAIP